MVETQVEHARRVMVRDQIERRGIRDPRVLDAMRRVAREDFVPAVLKGRAYEDCALPIGEGQTISQPYIVALMLAAADVSKGDKVLEVGAGSGYVAALLTQIGAKVTAIEIKPELFAAARKRLVRGVDFRCGDGRRGAPDMAPFDAILVSATGEGPPGTLVSQLALGGRLVMPVRRRGTELLILFRKDEGELHERVLSAVRFVPLV